MASTIHLAGLPGAATDAEVLALIRPYGVVRTLSIERDAQTGDNRGSALVEMQEEAASYSVIDALNGAPMGDHVLHAELIVSAEVGLAPRGTAGPARVATVQEATLAWEQLEAWLKVHAYAIWYSLNPVALPPEIARAEAQLGNITLPDDLKVAYNRHNGQNPPPLFAGNFRFCSLLEVVDRWRQYNATAQHLEDAEYWHPLWIPLTDNEGGDCHFLNLNRDDSDYGRVFFWSAGGDVYPYAENFTAMIEDLAEGLETERYFADDSGITDASTRWL